MSNDAMDHLVYRRPGKPKTIEDKERVANWHMSDMVGEPGSRQRREAAKKFEEMRRKQRKAMGL